MPDKKLHRVSIQGELWVMAQDNHEAMREAQRAITLNREEVALEIYPWLPTDPKFVDDDVLESIPYGADDERTVGDRLRELATARGAPAVMAAKVVEESK